MKKVIVLVTMFAVFWMGKEVKAQANDRKEIENLIFSYRDALNASEANSVVSLYTENGVLLPNTAPTAVGTVQVLATYQYVFDNFNFNLAFTLDEIVVRGDYAFARSTSKGSVVIKASGETVPDENRELFVLERVEGEWKIARYMYNKAKGS